MNTENKKKEILVPTSWNEVTVDMYQQLSMLNREDYKSDYSYSVDILEILCDSPYIRYVSLEVFTELSGHISFISESPKPNDEEELVIGDKTYRWVGNLNQLTVGEVISIEQCIDLEQLSYSCSLDVVAAVLLREVKDDGTLKNFDAKDFGLHRELFGKLPVSDIQGKVNFFIAGGKMCTSHSADYLVVPVGTPTSTQKKNWLSRKLLQMKGKLSRGSNG